LETIKLQVCSSVIVVLCLLCRTDYLPRHRPLPEYPVWQELAENLSDLASLFRSESFFPQLQDFLQRIFKSHMERLGWDATPEEPARIGTLRGTVIGIMGIAGDQDVLKEAFERFMAYANDRTGNAISGDLRGTIFRCALRYDEAKAFAALKQIYEDPSTLPEEQRSCLSVMGCVKDETRHAEMLDYVVFSGQVRYQDVAYPLASLSGVTDEGGLAVWSFLKQNFHTVYSKWGNGPMWAPFVALSCRGLTTAAGADEVESFFADPLRLPGSAKRRLIQALEVVRTKSARRDRDRASVAVWFTFLH
jgi:hypothetical protein